MGEWHISTLLPGQKQLSTESTAGSRPWGLALLLYFERVIPPAWISVSRESEVLLVIAEFAVRLVFTLIYGSIEKCFL